MLISKQIFLIFATQTSKLTMLKDGVSTVTYHFPSCFSESCIPKGTLAMPPTM